jgi:ankyrin repeat protein
MTNPEKSNLSPEALSLEIHFDTALRLGDVGSVKKLLAGTSVDPNFRHGDSAPRLHRAAASGSVELCQALLDGGALIEARDDSDMTALGAAAGSEHFEVCKLLVGAGAVIDAVDINGKTPLHHAAYQNQGTTCALLIAHGADLDHADNSQKTALHVAAEEGSASSCEVLIESGANMYALDLLHETPLHGACWVNAVEVCELFVEAGFDLNFVPDSYDDMYLTVTQRAVRQDAPAVVAYFLTKCGQDPNQVDMSGVALADLANKTMTRDLVRSIATEQAVGGSLETASSAKGRRASLSPL